jgi:cytochrome P450
VLPPEPNLAKLAQSIEWASRPYAFLERCAAELGDRFTIDLGVYGAFVIVSAPDDVRDVFRADPSVLHAGEGNGVLRRFLGDGSLLLLEEDAHLAERRLLLPAFTQARVRAHLGLIERATREALAAPALDVPSLRDAAERLSLRVILRIALGDTLGGEARELETRLRLLLDDPRFNLALLHQLNDAAPSAAMKSLIDSFAEVRALVEAIIAKRRAHEGEGDVLAMWLEARTSDGAPISDATIADELLTLVVTGYETTATALSWAGVWLTQTPRVSTKLAIAVRERSGAFHPYVEAVCREVLRIHPVIPIVGRRVNAPFRLGDLELPVGVTLAPSIHLAHRRVATWGDPDVFRPERFLEREMTPYEYFPFGGGTRRCLGRELAMLELRVAVAHVAMHGGFTLEDAQRVSARRRSVTVAPVAARARTDKENAA